MSTYRVKYKVDVWFEDEIEADSREEVMDIIGNEPLAQNWTTLDTSELKIEAIPEEVTEPCANCGSEVTLFWSFDDGYQAFCPYCGDRLMLCGYCPDREKNCTWSDKTKSCHRYKPTGRISKQHLLEKLDFLGYGHYDNFDDIVKEEPEV